jgi:hypothetical protein
MSSEPSHVEIELSADVHGYFAELVQEATRDRQVDATNAATSYLSALLADYAKPGVLNRDTLERPFTLLLAEALESAGQERFERLRAVGDGALYVRGFFSEHLETRGVQLKYVSSVGARAYDGAASMLRRSGGGDVKGGPDVFGELAERFDAFVALLSSIANRIVAQSGLASDGGVLKLYERWLRTGSSEIAQALGAHGLIPIKGTAGTA